MTRWSFVVTSAVVCAVGPVWAGSALRIGPVKGVYESWRVVSSEITLPTGKTVSLELAWGLGASDLNTDGKVNLVDYGMLSTCFSGHASRRPSSCLAESYAAADIDGDGDVDMDDAGVFRTAFENSAPFVVRSIRWEGAREISRDDTSSIAEAELAKPGRKTVRVQARLFDSVADREIKIDKRITLNVVDSLPEEPTDVEFMDRGPARPGEVLEPRGGTTTLQMHVRAWPESSPSLSQMNPGEIVFFQVGVSVADSDGGSNPIAGLAGTAYDVSSAEAACRGYQLSQMQDAPSGYDINGNPANAAYPYYAPSLSSTQPNYGGGWGFDRAGLDGGGLVNISSGLIQAAGVYAPLQWFADENENYPGLQPNARLGVGQGLYTFPPDDPFVAGIQGGFGQDLSNTSNPTPGDGIWFIQEGSIDTTGWEPHIYSFQITPGAANIFDGTLDFTVDQSIGFRLLVLEQETAGASFSFTLLPRPLYVDASATGANDGSSWADAYNELRDALSAAASAGGDVDEIWVAAGTYTPGTLRSDTFALLDGVGVYGGFSADEICVDQRDLLANVTILSGDLSGNDQPNFVNRTDNSYHVVTASGRNATAIFDGFTVQGGYADGSNPNDRGAGILNDNGSPVIRNCIVTDNGAKKRGAGMENLTGGTPLIEYCTFAGNDAGVISGGGNFVNGGGMNCSSSSPTLVNCTFTDNHATANGGALKIFSATLTVVNCGFYGNTANKGGAVHIKNGNSAFTNCLYSGNSVDAYGLGGGVAIEGTSAPVFTNCTIGKNSADGFSASGGGMRISGSGVSATLANCILWGNTDDALMSTTEEQQITISGGSAAIDYCDIEGLSGGLGGTGNIGGDPLFADADGADDIVGTEDDDVTLSASSPCLDAADNTAVPADSTDLDGDGNTTELLPRDLYGNFRLIDDPATSDTGNGNQPIVDVGVHEFEP